MSGPLDLNITDISLIIGNSFTFTNITFGEVQFFPVTIFPLPVRVVLHILYNLVLICGVVGNLLVLYVIYSLPRMRTTTNYLLANLAVGDLIISSFCIPFTYISILHGYWPFGSILCQLVSPVNAIGVLVSAFTLVALSVEKYMAIIFPLSPRLRKSHSCWIIGGIWVAAAVIAVPIMLFIEVRDFPVMFNNDSNTTTLPVCLEFGWPSEVEEFYYSISLLMVQYFIPVAVLIFTYSKITYVIWGLNHQRPTAPGDNGEINLNRNTRTDRGSRKAVLLSLAVVVGYSLAWLPYNVDYIIRQQYPNMTNEYIGIVVHWLAMSHCFYNPLIYAWINRSFKNAFKDVCHKILCCRLFTGNNRMSRFNETQTTFSTSMSTSKSYRKIAITNPAVLKMKMQGVGGHSRC